MFDWLKKIFHRENAEPAPAPEVVNKMSEKPCKTCGKPISYNPAWTHIPNYCPECKAKYRAEQAVKTVKRTCRSCGKVFFVPSSVKYMPNYCKSCKTKFKEQRT